MQHQANERRGGEAVHGAPPIGHLYDVEGRQLLLHQSGTGGPAVVFAPGAGCIGLDYLNIHDQVSQFTTSVLYDRAGTGWSDQVDLPRSATEVADELRSLLHAAGVPAPYLLVGHSLGGIYTRRYAQRFPDEMAGLLFLEPAHEDFPAIMPKQTLLGKLRQGFALVRVFLHFKRFYRGLFERMFAQWPDSMRERLIEYHLRSWRIGLREVKNQGELYDEVRRGGDTPDVPLLVLTAMGIDQFQAAFMPEPYLREMNDGKRVLYTALAESVPRGEHRVLENAGHVTIHTDRPDAVVQAIRDLLDKVDR
ncbi:MAG: alpha/beta hydrolase [Acidobacteriota bacterium]